MFGGIAMGVALVAGLVLFLARPRLVWYVDAELAGAWNRFLQTAINDTANPSGPPPVTRFEVRVRNGDSEFPGRYGFTVSTNGPRGQPVPGTPIVMYPNLNRTRTFDEWKLLALDPWMVFRRHYIPEPSRAFLNTGDRGTLLLAGNDPRAVQAWTSQLLQESPGVFSPGEDVWRAAETSLVQNHPFQSGAFSFSWIQTWDLLFRDNDAFLYAPLSEAQAFARRSRHSGGLLDATAFPEPPGWHSFGLQADMLWTRTHGAGRDRRLADVEFLSFVDDRVLSFLDNLLFPSVRRQRRLAETEAWLAGAATQTLLADQLEWIPAHPSGVPLNTVAWQSQRAWLRSSYIWQGMEVVNAY